MKAEEEIKEEIRKKLRGNVPDLVLETMVENDFLGITRMLKIGFKYRKDGIIFGSNIHMPLVLLDMKYINIIKRCDIEEHIDYQLTEKARKLYEQLAAEGFYNQ